MNGHERFEILCAWVASGQGSADDLRQLAPHLENCEDCRRRMSDFAQLSALAIPLHTAPTRSSKPPVGMTARFLERAGARGIPLRRPASCWRIGEHVWPRFVFGTGAVAIAVLALMAFNGMRGTRVAMPVPSPHAAQRPPSAVDDSRQVPDLQAQIALVRQELAALELKNKALQRDAAALGMARTELAQRLTGSESDNTALRLQASTKDSRLTELETQLKQKQAQNSEATANVNRQQAELERLRTELSQRENELDLGRGLLAVNTKTIDNLKTQLSKRESDFEREHKLLAASTQARNLIVARNLHIIDVHDNDGSGRQSPFGRIFYTEGQSLVFYAYDLGNAAGRDTRVSFHVWGGMLGGQVQARNLGVFHSEDAAARRWVLTCDDARVLAEINTVFVTMESSPGDLEHPKGRRILYAFLGDPANHP